MEKEILVFIKEQYVRDAQAYTGNKIGADKDIDIYMSSDCEKNWREVCGPMLVGHYKGISREEAEGRIKNLYKDADIDVFDFYELNCQKNHISDEDKPELIGQIIDIFEDFLEDKGISIPNEERESDEDLDEESAAIIYGNDYFVLENKIKAILTNWGVVKNSETSLKLDLDDKSVCFLETLHELTAAINEGYISKDPANKSNILVYCLATETSPEGWYSKNIMTVASELVSDEEEYKKFKEAIQNARMEKEDDKKLNLNINIDFDGETLYISEESASGCQYRITNKKQLIQEVCDYIADTLDIESEYKILVMKKNINCSQNKL